MNLKSWLATKVFDWLDKHQPEELQRRIKAHVDRIAPQIATSVTMAYLDREKLLHCAACPQRHGLHRCIVSGREVYLCDKHYSQWQAQQMAEAHK